MGAEVKPTQSERVAQLIDERNALRELARDLYDEHMRDSLRGPQPTCPLCIRASQLLNIRETPTSQSTEVTSDASRLGR